MGKSPFDTKRFNSCTFILPHIEASESIVDENMPKFHLWVFCLLSIFSALERYLFLHDPMRIFT